MQIFFGRQHRALRAVALIGITAVGVASATFWSPTDQPVEAVGSANTWLGYLNEYRTESGLGTVSRESSWDAGTYNHSCYMNQNGLTHDEVPGKPGYTSSGATAGQNSNLAGKFFSTGDKTADAKEAIDGWMAAPYHAIGMLRPNWTKTSLGVCYTNETKPRYSATLDVLRGTTYGKPTKAVVFPGKGATTHLYRFTSESPNPTDDCNPSSSWGLPIIAMFPNTASNASATVSGPSGTWRSPQLCVLDYQDITNSLASGIVRSANAVIVIPPAKLTNGKYTVSVSAGGQSVNWSFNVKTSSSPTPTTTTVPRPTTTAPRPTTTAPRPTTTAPRPTTTAPRPTTTAPRPTTTAPRPTTTAPRPTTTAPSKWPPVATFTPNTDINAKVGQTLTFNGSPSYDPDGGRLTYNWRSTGVNGIASQGAYYTRKFTEPGRHGVELTIIDDEGQAAKQHINVWVAAPPIASFTPATDQYAQVGQTLTFDGAQSSDPDGGQLTYNWRSTGVNGIASTGSSYSRKFTQAGRIGVELTIIDDEGDVAKQHINVWVTAPQPPVATFTPGSDQTIRVGQTLTFDGSASKDPDGGRVTHNWRSTGVSGIASKSASYSRKFTKAGRFGVELTIIDDEGQTSKQHINVWVR